MLALLFSFFFSLGFACDFSPEIKKVYSLSGTISLALRDLNLLSKPALKAVSVFHPIDKKDFKGEFLPGGVFLSHHSLTEMTEGVLFYDESRELTRILSKFKNIKAIEVKTRGLSPLQVSATAEKLLAPYTKGCALSQLSEELKSKLEVLKKSVKTKESLLFFLGAIRQGKWPSLLMVNDGVVKWLKDEKIISTYPSELAYVNWAAKMIHEMPKNTFKIGIVDSGSEMKSQLEKKGAQMNLIYPGSLIPGTGQVEAMIYLFKNL